jgi:cytochrome c biogenesis protein CcdA
MIPMVYGKDTTNDNRPRILVIHTLSSVVGGASVGFCMGCLSTFVLRRTVLSIPFLAALVGIAALMCALREAGLVRLPLLESRWMVPRQWAVNKSNVGAASSYGFLLGMGLFTRLNACLYPVILWVVLQGRPTICVLVMAIFGLFRTLPIWIIYLTSQSRDGEYPRRCIYSLGQWQAAVRLFSAFGLAMIGNFFTLGWVPFRIG